MKLEPHAGVPEWLATQILPLNAFAMRVPKNMQPALQFLFAHFVDDHARNFAAQGLQ